MANLYVAEATIRTLLGDRATPMLDRDGDAAEDTGLLAILIGQAGNKIDAVLGQKLEVPFAQITDSPATPGIVEDLAIDYTLWLVYRHVEPDGRDCVTHKANFESMAQAILDGNADVPGAARQTAAKGRHIAVYSAATPVFGGYDSDLVNRTSKI